jgi:hypothetical protein
MPQALQINAQLTPPLYAERCDGRENERTRLMNTNIYRPTALLALFAAAVLAAGLLAMVGAKSAWAAEPNFEPAKNYPIGPRAVLEMVDLPQPAHFSFLFRERPELGGGPSVCCRDHSFRETL